MTQLRYLLTLTLCVVAAARGFPAAGDAEPATSGSIEERPAALVPARPRTEAEEDRLVAAAQFAHGRVLLHQGDRHGALRRFERAWRYDPDSLPLLQEIVALASGLNRLDEAARYAVLAAERCPQDPQLCRQLGALLVERNELPRALRMLERATQLDEAKTTDAAAAALRLEMGRLYFILGEHQKAAESFALVRQAVEHPEQFGLSLAQQQELFPKPALLCSLMSESFLSAGRLDEATEMFRKAHGESHDDALLAFQLARVAVARQQWAEARSQLDQYFRAKSSAAGQQPYELLRQILSATESDAQQANAKHLSVLTDLRQQDTSNLPLGYFLAKKLLEAQQLPASEALYTELIDRKPVPDAYQGLSEIYRRQRQADKLLRLLGRAVDQTGSLELCGRQLREIVADREFLPQLVDHSQHKLAQSPQDVSQSERLGMALLTITAGRFAEAEAFYNAAFAAQGREKSQIMATVGLALYLANQGERAASVFQAALAEKSPPEKAAAHYYYLAGALELAGRSDEGVKAARQAAAMRPESPQFQSRPAWVFYHAHRYPEAEKEYLALLDKLAANYESAPVREVVREARLVLSNICAAQQRLAESEEWLQQILDEFPEDHGAQNDLGYLWADQGKHLNRALAMVRSAVEGEPSSLAYRDSLGWAYFQLGRYQEAVRELERAAQTEQPDGVILDHLADAYWKAAQRDKAVATWRRAVEAFRAEKEAKSLEKVEAKIKQHAGG